MRIFASSLSILTLLLLATGQHTLAQTGHSVPTPNVACPTPALSSQDPNIFSEEQEEWLGEILAPQIENELQMKKVPDPENDYLQNLAQKLLQQLPTSGTHYRLTIVDMPENNSFGIPGGHIYISRRIISLAHTEDELAGLIGHEIGHIITRQATIDLTRRLHDVLGVSSLGDRKDVQEKWNRLLDMAATKPDSHSEKREEAEQLVADRLAIYAMARAGYQPSSFVDFFDRLAQTKGNKGNFWTDLFGRTSSDAKRLRELVRTALPLGQNCLVTANAPSAPDRFLKWQKEVIASDFSGTKEAIPGLVSKQSLKPPLRSDLRLLRFSPDGKYLLAQDENSIYVLTANPVTNLFRVDSPDTFPAQFTPDSQAIVFYDKELRVQKWDLHGKRVFIRELGLPVHCLETVLSHSGQVLACLDDQLQAQLIDVSTSALIFKARKLRQESSFQSMLWYLMSGAAGAYSFYAMHFSPDDHYFLAGHENSAVAFDLSTRSEIAISRGVKDATRSVFAFLSSDELAGYTEYKGKFGIVRVRFPSGDVNDFIPRNYGGNIVVAGNRNYVLLVQGVGPAVTAIDWRTKQTALMYKKRAFDIYDDAFAGETAGGEIGLYDLSDKKYKTGVDLPNGPLFTTTASAFSPNGKWLAVSQNTRGAVWNLETGERVFLTRGFQGAFFDQDQLFAKFPKQGNEAAAVFKLDTSSRTLQNVYDLKLDGQIFGFGNDQGALYFQEGDLLLRGSRVQQKRARILENLLQVEVFDLRTNKKLWELKPRKELPVMLHSKAGKTVTVLVGNYEDMKAEARDDADISRKLSALADEKRRMASYIIEVLDEATGKELGKLLVDTGNLSFKVLGAQTMGDRVLIADSEHRTLVYSLKTGEQKAALFGRVRALSNDGRKMLLENENGKADLYDVGDLHIISHYEFPFQVVQASFSNDGRSLRVLTGDQTIYNLKLNVVEERVAQQ